MIRPEQICVINACHPNDPGHCDSYVDYRDGRLFVPGAPLREFRSWHSLAAALGTEFFAWQGQNFEASKNYRGVILLVQRDLSLVVPLVQELKALGVRVYVAFHENMDEFLLFKQIQGARWLLEFLELIQISDGQWLLGRESASFFKNLHSHRIIVCNHAVPYFEWPHRLAVTAPERVGILIGTRTLNHRHKRNTLIAIAAANAAAQQLNTTCTYLNEDPDVDPGFFAALGLSRTRVVKGPVDYCSWLSIIARHRLVVHYDMVGTYGQVVTDAAMVGVPCIGGNSDMNWISDTAISRVSDLSSALIAKAYAADFTECFEKIKSETSFSRVRGVIVQAFNS